MSCKALKSRVLPRKQLEPLKFGVAYARVVYKDYEILEDELRSSYHPQNYFCYSVDKTAGDEFTRRITTLSKCLQNVLVPVVQYDVNRYGSYMNHAFYECLKLLITKQEWQYVLLMQVLGVDEVLIPTLQVSDIFDMPGRFTGECVTKGASVGFMSRVALWEPSKGCHSGYFRHSVCVFGIEDFAWLPRSPRLMANKMMPDFDYAVVDCVHELLFNRTHLNQDDHPLNLTFYEDLPYVRYHKNRLKPNPDFKLVCKYGIPGDLSLAYRNISERSSLVNCTR